MTEVGARPHKDMVAAWLWVTWCLAKGNLVLSMEKGCQHILSALNRLGRGGQLYRAGRAFWTLQGITEVG